MAMVKKSITITDQQNEWIKAQIAKGNFGNESEVFRDLIRREQSQAAEIEAIRDKFIEAEKSGFSEQMPEEIRQAVQERLKKNGRLKTE